MQISRRAFLKYCSVAAGALGLSATDLVKLEKAFAVNGSLKVIWLNGQACTGCTVSLANSVYYMTLQDLTLYNTPADAIDLLCNETLSGAQGDAFLPAKPAAGSYVLAVEGAIPTKNTHYCEIAQTIQGWSGGPSPVTIYDAVTYYGADAAAILSIGTCASYGGIPGAKNNPTKAKGVTGLGITALTAKTVNIPGCPPNPNWIVGTIAFVLTALADGTSVPDAVTALATATDNIRRPKLYFGGRQCTKCYRMDEAALGHFVGKTRQYDEIGDPTKASWCLRRIGCKGPKTQSDCSYRQWHSPATGEFGVNWCVGAGAPCQGCTQSDFPDRESPFLDIL